MKTKQAKALQALQALRDAREAFIKKPCHPNIRAVDAARNRYWYAFGVTPSIYVGFGK